MLTNIIIILIEWVKVLRDRFTDLIHLRTHAFGQIPNL